MTENDLPTPDDDDNCPVGPTCGIHHRVDEENLDDYWEDCQIITYCGDKAVLTDLNEEADSLNRYVTHVLSVGDDTVWDSIGSPIWRQEHNSFPNVTHAHRMVVDAVNKNLLTI